jgi:ABC-type uncharacterized transport system permease subunit
VKLKLVRVADPEDFKKFGWAPTLMFDIATIELSSACAGTINAEVRADLKLSEMLSTGMLVSHPLFKIWSNNYLVSGPFQSFSSHAIQTSEQLMKEFVNDWTASQ